MRKSIILSLILVLPLSGCFRTREEIAREREEREVRSTLQQNVVQTGQGLEQMQAEIGRLQGRMEEMEHRYRKEIGNLGANRDGSEKTIAELKSQIESLRETQATLFEEIKKLKEENLQLTTRATSRATAPASPQKKSAAGASGDYDAALKAYLAKDYDSAIEGFREYIDANPRAKKKVSAHYYLGDSLYRKRDYTNAILELGVVHEKDASNALGRKSTLRIVESFKALGKEKDARAFAQILLKSSPDSEEAKKVKKLVK